MNLTHTITLAAALTFGSALSAQDQAQDQAGPKYVPGELLVKFKTDARNEHLADALARAGLVVQEHISTEQQGLVHATTKLHTEAAIRALENHPAVEYAEHNWVYTHSATATDSYFVNGSLWGLYGPTTTPRNTFGSQAAAAWANDHTGSDQIVIGIIDEGVNWQHPDLTANSWLNAGDPAGDANGDGNPDDDGNGYVDDERGWDFANGDNNIFDPADGDDHGTHVTGTICATANNGGVVGVAWNVKFVNAKFLSPNGGTLADAVKAVEYMTALKKAYLSDPTTGANIVALNNSWGGGGYSAGLHNAIKEAGKVGIVFVAAAGNSGWNIDRWANYPSNYDTRTATAGSPEALTFDSVISVTAIDSSGRRPHWANYGKNNVDLGAPGVSIWSTLPGGYGSYSGTSMATPHVTGAIGLYSSSNPAASVLEVRNALLNAAQGTYTSSLKDKCVTSGRLNASSF